MRRVLRIAAVLFTLLVVGSFSAWWGVTSRALGVAELEARLLAVPEHEPFARIGLRKSPLEFEVGGDVLSAELTWVHVPRAKSSPPARPIVLVHGTPDSMFAWRGVLFGDGEFEGLAGGAHDVWAIEVIGHGVSDPVITPVSFQLCADWVAAAIRALGLRDVCLVGQSYGGEFAWRAALDHPELVDRLVLIDSSGWPRPDDGWLSEEVEMRENPLADLGWLLNTRERVRSALDVHYGTAAPAHAAETFFLCCSRPSNWYAMIDLVRDEDGRRADELAGLRQPTLLLFGERDLAYPASSFGRRFGVTLPNARLVVVRDAGHYPHVEQPASVIRAVRAFAASP